MIHVLGDIKGKEVKHMGNKNYQFFGKQNHKEESKIQKVIQDNLNENKEEVIIEEIKEHSKGHITGSPKVYLRSKPDKNSDPLTILDENDQVEITDKNASEDFYKVCTATGLEGYCMKKFVAED